MKKYINTSNYYLSTTTSKIENTGTVGTFDVSDVTADWVTLPEVGYYWVDVDFGDATIREIFRIKKRVWYTLYYDARISPYGMKTHQSWASVGLRDFSQLLNSLSTNTDNFWEVEKLENFKVLVRGGNVFVSGYNYNTVDDQEFTFNANEEKYIEYDWVSNLFNVVDIPSVTNYLIAKVECWANMISDIIDKRSTVVYWGWEWDMKWELWKQKYIGWDETHLAKEGNIYDMDNMEQWADQQWMTPTEKAYWNAKQQQLVSWQNIVTINGKSIIDVSQWEWGNIPLDTILTCWWHTYVTDNWVSSFTFDSQWYPLTPQSFIVFSDSGTMMTEGWSEPNDYTYNDETHTITFNEPLASTEHAVVWLMYNNSDSVTSIWSWTIQLQRNWVTIPNWQFNVNQDDIDWHPQVIELWGLANDSTITFTQWAWAAWEWEELWTISTNQETPSSINVKWNIPVTQEEYDDLPDGKLTDWNWYFIYEE